MEVPPKNRAMFFLPRHVCLGGAGLLSPGEFLPGGPGLLRSPGAPALDGAQ